MSTTMNASAGPINRVLYFLVLAISVWGCEASLLPPPDQIIGRWSTDAPRHRDRIFEIKHDAVVFGTGKFSPARAHILIGVEELPVVEGWHAYRIHYREFDGSIGKLELHHVAGPRDQLRFANHREIWTRAGAGEQDDA